MRRGEKVVFAIMGIMVVAVMVKNALTQSSSVEDRTIPYYTDAPEPLQRTALDVIRRENCRQCHSLWTVKNIMNSVPAPILDGMGSLHDEKWFYSYLSSPNPQSILPTRLKKEFQMPSYADLPESDRRVLAQYLASLKVKSWYLAETRKAERQKLTGIEEPSQ